MNKKINTKAPMFAKKEITIEAPVEKVWDLQTNIKNWPHWQPDITSTKLEDPLLKCWGNFTTHSRMDIYHRNNKSW